MGSQSAPIGPPVTNRIRSSNQCVRTESDGVIGPCLFTQVLVHMPRADSAEAAGRFAAIGWEGYPAGAMRDIPLSLLSNRCRCHISEARLRLSLNCILGFQSAECGLFGHPI